MNGDTVLKLIEAGFTADEIRKMDTVPEGGTPEVPTPSGEQGAGSNETHESEIAEITKSLAGVQETLKAIQEANLKNAHGGEVATPTTNAITSFIESL